jgi:hypothetical protein
MTYRNGTVRAAEEAASLAGRYGKCFGKYVEVREVA